MTRNKRTQYINNKFGNFSLYSDDKKNRTLNLSFGGMKKLSKESGFGY